MDEKAYTNLTQECLLGQAMRGLTAMGNIVGIASSLIEKPDIYKGEVKSLHKRLEREYKYYYWGLRGCFQSYTDEDIWEMILDAEVEYNKGLTRFRRGYENGMERILLRNNYRDHAFLSQLATASHIVGICAYIAGVELNACSPYTITGYHKNKAIEKMLHVGGIMCERSTYDKVIGRETAPSVMGHLSQISKRLVDAVLLAYGGNPDLTYEPEGAQDPIMRSLNMYGDLIIEHLMDYELIWAFFSKPDLTLEQASRMADKMDEEFQKKQQAKANK